MVDKRIEEIKAQLRRYRVEISQKSAEIEKKTRKYDMLYDYTPQEEKEADALFDQLEELEDKIEAIDIALNAL